MTVDGRDLRESPPVGLESPGGAEQNRDSQAGLSNKRAEASEVSDSEARESEGSEEGSALPSSRPAGEGEDSEDLSGGGVEERIAPSDAARVFALAGATFLLHLALEHLPFYGGLFGVMGAAVGLFAPAPAIQVFLRWGVRVGVAALVGVALAVGWAGGWGSSLQFLASTGVIAWMLSLAIVARRPVEMAVLWSVLGAAAGLGVLYAVEGLGMGGGLMAPPSPETDEGLRQLPGVVQGIDREEIERLVRIIGRLTPAVALMHATLISLLNYTLIRRVWHLRGAAALFPSGDLSRWSMPEPAVWTLIASAVSMFFYRGGSFFWVISNVILILLFGYFLQGLAIFHYLFRKYAIAVAFRIPLYFIAVTFSYVVAAFGLFDLWFDFRKIRTVPPSPDDHDADGEAAEEEEPR